MVAQSAEGRSAVGRRRSPMSVRALASRVGDVVVRTGLVVVAVVVWEVGTRGLDSIFFPPPSEVVRAIHALWLSDGPPWFLTDRVFADVVPSLLRIGQGWVLAAVVGVSLGIAIGRSRWASDVTMPIINLLRSTPGPALIPVFLILLGTGSTMRVSLIAFSSVWPVLLNTVDGVRSVDRVKLDTAAAFSLPRRAVLRRIVLPAAMPKIVAGLRVAIAIALVLMVISELVAATHGLGHHLAESQRFFRMTEMWAGIVLLAVLGYVFNLAFIAVERRLLGWHIGERRRGKD